MTDLEKAYRATAYRVFLPEGVSELRVGFPDRALAAWLGARGKDTWAVLTAANPASRLLSPRENAERQARLECILLEKGFEPYAGENVGDGGEWPVEESCLVVGISLPEAVALAQQFGQNAFLFGGADGVPGLVWTAVEKQAGE